MPGEQELQLSCQPALSALDSSIRIGETLMIF